MFGFSFLQVGGFEKFSRASCLLGCVRHLVFLFSIRSESTVSTINGLSHKNREKRKTMGKHNNREKRKMGKYHRFLKTQMPKTTGK